MTTLKVMERSRCVLSEESPVYMNLADQMSDRFGAATYRLSIELASRSNMIRSSKIYMCDGIPV